MNSLFCYPVTLVKQAEGGYLVELADFPEITTQGDNLLDALDQARDALEEAIANRIELKLDIPSSNFKGKHIISPSTMFVAKVVLHQSKKELGLNNTQLAKRIGCDEKEVRRLLDFTHSSKLSRIEEILHKLGKNLNVSVAAYG